MVIPGERGSDGVVVHEEFDAQRFETLLLDLSMKFINLPSDHVDQQIEDAQRRVCEIIDVEISALWQWNSSDPEALAMSHLYRPLGGPPVPERMEAKEFWPWALGHVREGKTLAVSSLDDLPPEAAFDREMWIRFEVTSSLCFPLAVGGEPAFGALSFNTKAERAWPDRLVRRLGAVAQVFASALARKRSDEVLRESEEKLALAAECAGAGLWSLDLQSMRYWVTPRILHLLGLPQGETLTLDRFLGLVHPDDRDRIRRTIDDVVRSGKEGKAEYRIVRPDGSERWLTSRGRACLGTTGQSERLMGATVDISERKRLEAMSRSLTGRIIAAHEEERARLARELHDDITQRLACMAVEAARIEVQIRGTAPEEPLHGLRQELARMSEDVHALSYQLHPAVLAELGLAEALRSEFESFTSRHSIRVELLMEGVPVDLPGDISLCAFRVAQEALRNVARHSGADRVTLTVGGRNASLELEVRDNGSGFDAGMPPRPPALGLSGMRERVRHLGGTLNIESAPGHGTTLIAWLPLTARTS